MGILNQKYLKLRILAIFIILISTSTLFSNFTHTHSGNLTNHQNCPACLLLNSLSESLKPDSEIIKNNFDSIQSITDNNEKLKFEQSIYEFPSRAPPIF